MYSLVKVMDLVLRWTLIVLAVLMIATVSWQVVSRYAFRDPSSVTEEIARFQLIWLGMLGAVYTFRNRMHVGIDLLTGTLTGHPRLAAEIASLIACLVFAVLILIIGGGQLVLLTNELGQTSAALGVKISWVYFVIPASGILWVLYTLHAATDIIRHRRLRSIQEIYGNEDLFSQSTSGPQSGDR